MTVVICNSLRYNKEAWEDPYILIPNETLQDILRSDNLTIIFVLRAGEKENSPLWCIRKYAGNEQTSVTESTRSSRKDAKMMVPVVIALSTQ